MIKISDDGYSTLHEFLKDRTTKHTTDEDVIQISAPVGKTVSVDVETVTESMQNQLNTITEGGPRDEVLKKLQHHRLPVNRDIEHKADLSEDQIIQLINLQDSLVDGAKKLVSGQDDEFIISVQRSLNLHRHTLDGTCVVDHPIEIVREVVEYAMKADSKLDIVTPKDIQDLDEYHKSIRDQSSIVDERLRLLNEDQIKPRDGIAHFISEMEQLGDVRKDTPINTNDYCSPDGAYDDLSELGHKVEDIIWKGELTEDEINRLTSSLHIEIDDSMRDTDVFVHRSDILLTITGMAAIVFIIAFIVNLLSDD